MSDEIRRHFFSLPSNLSGSTFREENRYKEELLQIKIKEESSHVEPKGKDISDFEKYKNAYIIKPNLNELADIETFVDTAFKAYKKQPNQKIDLKAEIINDDIVISVKDYGPGIPENIKETIKEPKNNINTLSLICSFAFFLHII